MFLVIKKLNIKRLSNGEMVDLDVGPGGVRAFYVTTGNEASNLI